MGIHIRVAERGDTPGLLELTRACPMEGRIPLLINREPDFFNLVDLRGESRVWIAEENNQPVGSISVYFQNIVYGNECFRIAQICDLKIEPSFRKTFLVYKLLKTLREFIEENNIDWMTTLISEGNKPSELLTMERAGFPKFQKQATFNVREFIPHKYKKDQEIQTSDGSPPIKELFDLFHQQKKNYLLFPNVDMNEFISESKKSNLRLYWTKNKNGDLSSFIAVIDTQNLKQNSVMSLPFSLWLGSGIQRTAASVFGTSALPKIGEPIRMAYVKYWNINSEMEFQKLIKAALTDTFHRKQHFLAIGLDENDSLLLSSNKFCGFNFKSNLYMASLKNSSLPNREEKYFRDFSLV